MGWMALEAGDAATWAGTVVTFGMACYAVAQGVRQRRDMRRQNELQAEASQLQRRQIEMTERRALAMERLLEQLTAGSGGASQPWNGPYVYGSGSYPPGAFGLAAYGPAAPAGAPAPGAGVTGGAFAAQPAPPEYEPAGTWTAMVPGEPAPPGPPPAGDAAEEPSEDPDPVAEEELPEEREELPGGAAYDEGRMDVPPPDEPAEPADVDFVRGAGSPSTQPGGYGHPQPGGHGTRPKPKRRRPRPADGPLVSHGPPASGSGYGTAVSPPPYQPQAPAPAQPEAPYVPASPWRIERVGRHLFALRNTGTTTLTGVHVERSNLPDSARGVPEDAVVRPGETAEFLMAAGRGQALPATVLVSWHGQPWAVQVHVPQD